MNDTVRGRYDASHHLVDYILGITYEIWEEGGVDLIHQYYAPDCIVWGLDGITRGAEEVVAATRATGAAFPGRHLIAEDVIWSDDGSRGLYSSHRLLSVAVNQGATAYGPATGREVRLINVADCVVEDAVITEEWLVRDNMAVVTQLAADAPSAAQAAANARTEEHAAWLEKERARVEGSGLTPADSFPDPAENPSGFAEAVLADCWSSAQERVREAYAPYAVMRRSPQRHYSGRTEILGYYAQLSRALGRPSVTVDHVAAQPHGAGGIDVAVRWSVAGQHDGSMFEESPTGRPLYILGITHWRCLGARIIGETTVFDALALLSQTMARR